VKRIAVDIGNSTIACALFDDTTVVSKWYHGLEKIEAAVESIREMHHAEVVSSVAISTVVPAARDVMKDRLEQAQVPVFVVSLQEQRAITNTYPTLGLDRLANLVSLLRNYVKDEADAGIVIDFGTATTLTAVSKTGQLLGGMITLGLRATLKAIYSNADQLPLLDVENVLNVDTLEPLATTTKEAIINGTVLAQIALVERWIKESKKRIDGKAVVVATGGSSHYFSDAFTGSINFFDSDLTLKGINLIAEEAEDRADRD